LTSPGRRADSGSGGFGGDTAGPACAVCTQPIGPDELEHAMVWADPAGNACCAHHTCLRRLGETDLRLKDAGQ
jgi:hypothetical protein